ncbi:MAG: class I SAM-dependent methyltransferase [Ornithinimicrobium sp.]
MSDVEAASRAALTHVLGHQAVSAGSIGIRAGLFAAIDSRGSVTAQELADVLEFDEHLVSVWCRAAFAFEMLDVDTGGRYRLASGAATVLLDEADPLYMGGRSLFATATYEDTLIYPEALAAPKVRSRSESDPLVLEAMRVSSGPDSTMLIEHVLPQIPELVATLDDGGAVLEVGSGAGRLCLDLARRFPATRVVALESDAVSAEQARATVQDAGLGDRVEVVQADANQLADHDVYDLVVMNRSLHEVGGSEQHLNVLRRSADALRAEGWTVVSELPYPDNEADYRDEPDHRRLAGAQLHEAIVGCAMITTSQLPALMRRAGYDDVRVVDQPRSSRIVSIGRRPSPS